jgi:hypothetical protein
MQAVYDAAGLNDQSSRYYVLRDAVNNLLAQHAHELAEKLRTAPFEPSLLQAHQRRRAADLIAPASLPAKAFASGDERPPARQNREVGEGALVYALRQVWTEEQVQNGLATYRRDLRAEDAEEIRTYARQMNDPHGPYRTAVKMADLFAEHLTTPVVSL